MHANRIIDRIVRQVMRQLVNKGVNKGFDIASRSNLGTKQGTGPKNRANSDRDMTSSANRQKQNMRQAQRMMRQMRRFIRF